MMRAAFSVSHMAFANILLDVDAEGIALPTLNRPARLNALNKELLAELDTALEQIEADPNVRAIILTGAGNRAFVAGADITELADADALAATRIALQGQATMRRLETGSKPSVAAINGFALGGGLELAMCCTIRVATAGSKLGQPETKLGLTPGYGATQRLPRLVGQGRALELLLTGEAIDASEAWRIGLVNRVVEEPSALLGEARAILRRMLSNGPVALRLTMQAVDVGMNCGIGEGLRFEANAFGLAAGTEDRREGTRAFLEKRQPKFTGK
jgi:enoyl-CoA hydratase